MKPWLAHEQDPSLQCCRTLRVKHAAYASVLYTLNVSILVVLLCSWRIGVNAKRCRKWDDVYYGVQIAYFTIIGMQMFMIMLSLFLFYGIYKENVSFLVPWVLGCMTFMAMETMALVYCNVLRDHVNNQFDAICKAEISFLLPRIVLNATINKKGLNYQFSYNDIVCMHTVCSTTIPLTALRGLVERISAH